MKKFLQNIHGDMGSVAGMIGVVVAFLVSVVIGVLIWYKINPGIWTSTMSTWTTAATTGARAAFNSTNASANTIWTLFPIVAIVIIAGIILGIVTNFGRGQA